MPSSADVKFLKNTRFFQSLPDNAMGAVLENFSCREVKSGERFINQGEPGDRCYTTNGSSLLLALGQSHQFAFYQFPKFAIAIFHHKESRADLTPHI